LSIDGSVEINNRVDLATTQQGDGDAGSAAGKVKEHRAHAANNHVAAREVEYNSLIRLLESQKREVGRFGDQSASPKSCRAARILSPEKRRKGCVTASAEGP
jgi:hypothetical protein